MKSINRFFTRLFKNMKSLDPVVGLDEHGGIIYGRFDSFLGDDDFGDYWIHNIETGSCESCYNIKKITESELLSYVVTTKSK